MREIHISRITEEVKKACIKANKLLPDDLCGLIKASEETEQSELGKSILADLSLNIQAAKELDIPVCQDTGMAIIFVDLGQDVRIIGGSLNAAINEGVRQGYTQGLLRCSVVADPLRRSNTGDNTPAIIYTTVNEGEGLHILVSPKGFGSENMSRIKMFTPAAAREDIVAFVAETALLAGSNPCPPIVLGVGIGGNFEYSALLAKKALCKPVAQRNSDDYYAKLEADMLSAVNALGIGPQGFGGSTTALAVNIEQFPTHIAGLPVAVNVGCHITRHAEIEI
ncbi:MAG: fumarate hydratase [Oscillospiraceae bacterium]|jgi:fumarate hydratase subunit alpha|nr:fumarate hydratase [Oscillospiraceae bacterium]